MADHVNLVINGRRISASAGQTLLDAGLAGGPSRTTAPPASATPAASGSIPARWMRPAHASATPFRRAGRA